MTLGSRVIRLTDGEPVEVTSRVSGAQDRRFESGMSPADVSRAMEMFAGDPSPRSVSVEIVTGVDIAREVARGASLYTASAELSQWWPGQAWEDRRVLVQGRITEPLIGAVGEVFAFAISEGDGEDSHLIPPTTAIVGTQTLPTRSVGATGNTIISDNNIVGATYPLVIGAPGQTIETISTGTYQYDTPASPVLFVERDQAGGGLISDYYLLISYGVADVNYRAGNVKIFNLTDTTKTFTDTTAKLPDKLGQMFTFVIPNNISLIPAEGDELWCSWDPTEGGGLQDPYGEGPLRSADHVIRWALDQSSLRVDRGEASRLGSLSSIKIDGYINAPVSPWEWLSKEILPLLPVSAVSGPGGVYVTVWDFDATAADAVLVLEEGLNCERVTPLAQTSTDDVVNHFTFRFAVNASNGVYSQHRVLTGEPTPEEAGDEYVLRNYWCRRSQSIWGVRQTDIRTNYLYDTGSAEQVLTWMARFRSFPRRMCGYQLGREHDWLRPGDVVALTDGGLSISGQAAWVESVTASAGGIVVALVWLEPLVYAQ